MNSGHSWGKHPLRRPLGLAPALAALAILLVGCQSAPAPSPSVPQPTTPLSPAATATIAAPQATASPTTPAPPAPSPMPTPQPAVTGVTVAISPGTVARYLVREQFARQNLPNDAVGETPDVTGALVFDAAGQVVPGQSKITINARTLHSDESDRDDYLWDDGLETGRFQNIDMVVESASGLPWPLPQQGEVQFQLQGSMTAHGVTSPTTWEVTARFAPGGAQGQAKTSFPFNKFGMVQPTAFFLLSVEDNIRLELDFVVAIQPRN